MSEEKTEGPDEKIQIDTETAAEKKEVATEKTEPERVPLFRPTKIELGYSDVHGRGVFATNDIKKGELIERCPMIQLAFRTKYHKDPQLFNYLYTNSSCGCEECQRHGNHMYMVLGYGMLYNHQDAPNANWSFNWSANVADLIAQKDIATGTEIFTSYGSRYFSNGRAKIVVDTGNDPAAAEPTANNPLP